MEGNNSYRVRTGVGSNSPDVLNVKLNQSFEFLNILSLKIGQKNLYKMPSAPYGVVVGRVLANQTFGIENAKVSIFIPKEDTVFDVKDDILYTYTSSDSVNYDGVRYNLLPSHIDEECHQDVGTMFEKEYVLDNDDVIRVFDKYYTYTTKTNGSGDYFIYGVPVGQHTLHVDVDLSDIGKLSVRPHDMIGQGYDIGMFESPNKFKTDKNLNILPQIKTQDKPIQVFPFWGDTSDDDTNAMITRADIEIDYKFEPTAVFMGSIITDSGNNSISHKCVPNDLVGKMSELTTGAGKIEMIRKTFDGKVEEFSVKGNRVIDDDGVWCYQIPMNLDYVGMDEFGNIVPTEDPNKGIPTRARVRFRISMDEDPMDDSAKKRARFLVPNNPRLTDDYPDFKKTLEADYSFGTFTKEESYRDLFWNNVYTVKSYIPRLQRRATANTKKFTGIKMTNRYGGNNPMPYNNISIKMNFQYRLLCSLTDMFLRFISVLNTVLAYVGIFLFYIGVGLAKFSLADQIDGCEDNSNSSTDSDADETEENGSKPILRAAINSVLAGLSIVIRFSGDLCEDGDITDREKIFGSKKAIEKWANTYIKFLNNWKDCSPLCNTRGKRYLYRIWRSCTFKLRNDDNTYGTNEPEQYIDWLKNDKVNDKLVDNVDDTMNCVQSMLAQENEVTSFNFHNDWVNGVLYAPLWYRKIKPRRRVRNTNLSINKVDDWCSSDPSNGGRKVKRVKIAQTCSQQRVLEDDRRRIRAIEKIFTNNGEYIKINGRKSVKDTEKACFGLKCHEKNISLIKVDNGIIVRNETKYGEYVYYYKSVEYSDKEYMENILDGNESRYGDVKLLFATDLVLLGNLNECNTEGIPQFFKYLSETTYQMPPDLVSVAYDENDDTDDSSLEQITSFSTSSFGGKASHYSTVETEFSGADYGNVGVGQFGYDPNKGDGYTQLVNTKTNPGYDNGGLFYDLTCTSGFVSPKGCVNLSRVCEFGVSLDQSVNLLDSNEKIVFLPPDGFVSYDELYNMDARSMFSTMNCNRLRERVDEKTGYKTYDFNYNYPENFDGTLMALMSTFANSEVEYKGNYNLEKNSDAYLKFRYGFDKDKFKVGFYNTTDNVKNNPNTGNNSNYTQKNERRFPRYENSFYFYFGLKSGSTAINKFREEFYSECTNDAPSESIISLDYKPNSWCSNHEYDTDGYISFDLSNIQLPCTISFDEVTEGDAYDVEYTGITSYKLYIGSENERLNSENYDRLYVDLENTQVDPSVSDNYKTPFLYNGVYVITITDSDGNIYKETVSMVNPTLSFGATPVRFTMTNEELENRFSGDYEAIASDIAMSEQIPLLRSIGGYITVSSITNVNTPITDNFSIEIASESEINGYQGSRYIVRNGNVTKDGVNPIGELNGEYSFGVPKGNENYIVTVTEFCSEYAYSGPSENKETMRIYVGEPESFKMLINGVDISLLTEFETGYIDTNTIEQPKDGVIDNPYNGYNEDCGIGYGELEGYCVPNSSVKGWDDIGDIGVYKLLTVPSVMVSYASISNTVNLLTESLQPEQYVYNFTDEYYFDKTNIGLSSEDSLEDYFNTDIEAQINVITELNQVIQRRIDLAESMYNAFCIYSDEEKMVSIQTQTSEKPVKTLIYYNPDYTSLAFEDINGNIQQLHPAGYYIFDEKKEENEIVDFGEPTITIKKKMVEEPTEDPNEEPRTYPEYYPIFKKFGALLNISYKLPPYCAVMNGINETLPSNIGTIPFGGSTIREAMAAQTNMAGNGMNDMFGFHMIDKRPFTRLNIWLPVKNYPFYWPDIDESQEPGYEPPEGAERGGYITMNGCVSGYLYNCFSTSTTQIATFDEQSLGDGNKIEFYTITTRGGTNIPDEYAIPTKRVMYSQPKSEGYIYTYNDFECNEADEDYLSFDYGSRPVDTNGVDTTERYISFTQNATSLTVTGKFNNFSESLGSNLFFGIPENTIVCYNYDITPIFINSNGENVLCDWRFFNAKNPIYQKVYDNSHSLINEIIPDTINPEESENLISMLYGWDDFLPNNNSITDQAIKRVFAVGRSIDGKIRAFSPTYEISKVQISSFFCNNDEYYCVDILFNTNNDNDDYYLKYYPYRIFLDVYYKNGINEKYESDIIKCDYENLEHVQINNIDYKFNRTTFLFIGRNKQEIDEIVVTVKDVTSIIRLTERLP